MQDLECEYEGPYMHCCQTPFLQYCTTLSACEIGCDCGTGAVQTVPFCAFCADSVTTMGNGYLLCHPPVHIALFISYNCRNMTLNCFSFSELLVFQLFIRRKQSTGTQSMIIMCVLGLCNTFHMKVILPLSFTVSDIAAM